MQQYPRRESRSIAFPELNASKRTNEQDEAKKTAPDLTVGPGVRRAAPLQCEEETDDGSNEKKGAEEVDLVDLLFECEFRVWAFGVVEEEEDGGDGDGADGEVDVETPAPGDSCWCVRACESGRKMGTDYL